MPVPAMSVVVGEVVDPARVLGEARRPFAVPCRPMIPGAVVAPREGWRRQNEHSEKNGYRSHIKPQIRKKPVMLGAGAADWGGGKLPRPLTVLD